MFPPRRRHRRGWTAPFMNAWDWIQLQWWNTRRFFSRLFDFRWVTRQLGGFLEKLWWGMKYPFIVISWLLQQAWSVMVAWWQIRNFRYLIQGLPALLAIIFVLIISAYTYLRSDDGLQELYKRQAIDARQRGDRQKAQLCLERLMQLQYVGDPSRLETQFELGKLSSEMQQHQRARALLTALANPDNDEGYAKAHLERARFIHDTRRSNEDLDLMERHLRRALKKVPDDKESNSMLGLVMYYRKRFDEAIPLLAKSDPRDVNARLTLASIHKTMGNEAQADMYIKPLIEYLTTNAQGEIDNLQYPLILARAHRFLDEFEKSIDVLKNAYRMKKSDLIRAEMSNTYLHWYGQLQRMPITPEREQFKLDCIVNALEWDDRNVQALAEFVKFMGPSGSDAPIRDDAHRMLTALKGNNAYLHLYLGHKLYSEGKVEEARAEWSLAFTLNPNSPMIVNNFAWILTHGKPGAGLQPDLIRAETLINQVITRTTKDDVNKPKYHGTRGTIYMKMGRYQEARADFTIAMTHRDFINDITLQSQLVEVNERLGLKTEADMFRKKLQETLKRNTRVETEKAVQ